MRIPLQATEKPGSRALIKELIAILPEIDYTPRNNGEADFYGASDCIARSLGLPRPLYTRATWIHGWYSYLPEFHQEIVTSEQKDIANLVINADMVRILNNNGYKNPIAAGAPFLYARSDHPQRDKDSIIVFVPHSTVCTTLETCKTKQPYIDDIVSLKKVFRRVVVSVGGADVLHGNWIRELDENNIPWVTGAWIFDRNAYVRLHTLFHYFGYATTNNIGSHIPYACYCGCKMSLWGDTDDTAMRKQEKQHPFYKKNPQILERYKHIDRIAEFRQNNPAFFVRPDQATTHREWACIELGEQHKKTPEEIARIFEWRLKPAGKATWQAVDPADYLTNDELIKEAARQADTGQYDRCFQLTNILKRRQVKLPGIDLIRGRYFLHQEKKYHAREAIKEELRHFPDNTEAKALLQQLGSDTTAVQKSTNPADREFIDLLNIVRPFTKLSTERARSLYKLARRVCAEDIPGNIVECGVAAGGSTMLMALVLKKYSARPRKVYAFDTFTGMPAPGRFDTARGVPADETGWGTGTCAAPEEYIRSQCAALGLRGIVETRKGLFEDSLPAHRGGIGRIALLHLDADWYASTMTILTNLYDQLHDRAFMQIDDYGAWDGCRKAIDEYAMEHGITFDLHRIDETGMWCRKPAGRQHTPARAPSQASAQHRHCAFTRPALRQDTMDLYLVRSGILKAMNAFLPRCTGTLLDIGCGEMPYRDHILQNSQATHYIGLDFKEGKYAAQQNPDIAWDGKHIPLARHSIDWAMATEVLEHCPDPERVLKEINRVLRPGGGLFFTVPFLWPLHDMPQDEYRYTPFSLERHLSNAGFHDIELKALGGWDAALAQMIGLWVKRKPMSKQLRQQAMEDFFPLYKQLVASDIPPDDFTKGHNMVTGLYGTAVKTPQTVSARPPVHHTFRQAEKHAVIITNLFPKLSETFILDQMTGLLERQVNFEIWAMKDPREPCIHKDVRTCNLLDRTRYITLPDTAHLADPAKWRQEFLKQNPGIDLERVTFFHVHFGILFNRLQPLFADAPQPVLVSFHGLDASQYIKKHGDACYAALFQKAALITTPSRYMKTVLTAKGCPESKIKVHRYGVNLEKFKPTANKKKAEKRVAVLTVGRLVEKKGLENAIRAFSLAGSHQAIYRIIGDGPLKDRLRHLVAKLNLGDKVAFLGPQPKDRIVTEMQQADIFMLPSITAKNGDQEGVPVTLIEAHAVGLPVVSTRHSGIPELVADGETGLLSEEHDTEALAKNLQLLMTDAAIRNTMAQNARKRVQVEFNSVSLNDTLAMLYRELSTGAIPARAHSSSPTPPPPRSTAPMVCPICNGTYEQFLPFGVRPRPNAQCPGCKSLERHRLIWLYISQETTLLKNGGTLLHVAPERFLQKLFASYPQISSTTVDRTGRNADYAMDITDLHFPDNTFDAVLCIHVLEHVPDDTKAMAEFFRVMKPGGWGIIQVPVNEALDQTMEGGHITDPRERKRLFGQEDHVRHYGPDYASRLQRAGFHITAEQYAQRLGEGLIMKYGLSRGRIYVCKKPAGTNHVTHGKLILHADLPECYSSTDDYEKSRQCQNLLDASGH